MSNILKDRTMIVEFLMNEFSFSEENVEWWLNTANGNFGYCTPNDLIEAGRGDKVMIFMIAAKEGY